MNWIGRVRSTTIKKPLVVRQSRKKRMGCALARCGLWRADVFKWVIATPKKTSFRHAVETKLSEGKSWRARGPTEIKPRTLAVSLLPSPKTAEDETLLSDVA